jgi:integrase
MHAERGLSMRTVHDSWIALKSFSTWAETELSTPHALRGKMTEPKYTKRATEPSGARDKTILLTLLDCGIRASECCALTLANIDAERGRLRIRKGKGDKEQFVFRGDRARKAIWRYLVKRGRGATIGTTVYALGTLTPDA